MGKKGRTVLRGEFRETKISWQAGRRKRQARAKPEVTKSHW